MTARRSRLGRAILAFSLLAGAFATERLRQLALMQPSAPAFAPFTLAEAV